MDELDSSNLPFKINHLATCTPSSTSRAWQSAPHPNLPIIATACSDKTVRVYSLTSFTLLSSIAGGHSRSVRCCAWKPTLPLKSGDPRAGETTLATGSFDATAAIWVGRPGGGKESEFETSSDQENDDGSDNEEDFRFAVVLEGHDSEVKSIAWSLHGTFLATCSRDKTVWIWEALDSDSSAIDRGGLSAGADDDDNYETVAVMSEHQGDVKCVAWHPAEEQCLASSSYDDLIRIWKEDIDGEWSCVGVCEGHEGTVWCIAWEPTSLPDLNSGADIRLANTEDGTGSVARSGPRLISCSDDFTTRIWRRKPKTHNVSSGTRIPSIIRNTGDDEEWYEEAVLPKRHERAIYSLSWSKASGRVVTSGSDGKIVVYEEKPAPVDEDSVMTNGDNRESVENANPANIPKPTWSVVAEVEAAHEVFEVNHVCWTNRYDKGRSSEGEEIIISTGDDGEVKIWTLERS